MSTNWIAYGAEGQKVEHWFENFNQGGRAVVVSSGTAAIYLCLTALNLPRGFRVGLPTYACSALLNAINLAGGTPVLLDVDLLSFNISLNSIPNDLDVIVPVHTFGNPVQYPNMDRRPCSIVEDCCHSIGGYKDNTPIGILGLSAIYSFYATKPITGGYGGLVWSKDLGLIDVIQDLIAFDNRETYRPRFNFYLSDIQSGLINSQLSRIDAIKARRTHIYHTLKLALPEPFSLQLGLDDNQTMKYRFVVRSQTESQRDSLHAHMNSKGITCIVPILKNELLHRYLNLTSDNFQNSERLSETTLSLPCYPSLTDHELERVKVALETFDCDVT